MNLTFLCASILTTSPNASSPAGFDRAGVAALVEDYAELGPVETATLGGGTPLQLVQVLASVRQHHPMLMAALAKVRSARGEQLAARGGFDPKLGVKGQATPEGFYDVSALDAKVAQPTPLWGLELEAGYRIGRAENLASYDPRETLDGGEVKGGLRLPLLRDGSIDARRADIRLADAGLVGAEGARDRDALQLVLAGADAYWTWVAAGEAYVTIRQLVRLAELRGRQLDVRVEAGDAAEIDRAENLRSLLKRREKLVQGLRKLQKAAIKLSLFHRDDAGQPVVPALERLPARVVDVPAWSDEEEEAGITRALGRRPELQVAKADVQQAQIAAQLANNGVLPRLDLELKLSKDIGTDNDSKTLESLEPFEIKALVSLEFPLLLRKGRGKAAKALGKLDAAKAKLQFTEEKLTAEVRDIWSALNASARRAKVARQAATVAELVAEAERTRLRAGATSPFVVNLREQAAADAQLVDIDARASLQVAWAAWSWLTSREAPL